MNNESKKTIGFVILVWNSEKVIDNCLKSIISLESYIPKIVVIDNGSTDCSLKILKTYKEQYPETVSIIHFDENKGTTYSRNAGLIYLDKIPTDYYCILDSDTQVNDYAFIKMEQELLNNPNYGIIGPKLISLDGSQQMSARTFPTLIEKIFKALPFKNIQKLGENLESIKITSSNKKSYPVDYLMSACWFMKKDVLSKVGLLDERIFYAPEDAEYCIRIWKSGYQVAFCSEAEIIHEWQRLSKKKLISRINYEHIKGLIYMFWKHKYLFSTSNLRK